MWKVSCLVLSVIALEICAIFVLGDSASTRQPPSISSTPESRNLRDSRPRQARVLDFPSVEYFDDEEFATDDTERSGKLIGKWRSNGEALEPKWRDGDAVPLVPFSKASKSQEKEDTIEVIADNDEDVFTFEKPRTTTRRIDAFRKERLVVNSDNYSSIRSTLNPPSRTTERIVRFDDNDGFDRVAMKYRETFQNRPNEYELNDDEYEKPRPRKRRPPQNYEFAEVQHTHPRIQMKKQPTIRNEPDVSQKRIRTKTPFENSELKNLLKMQQGEGLSLSEILQQRNLTLSDLLQGKADVINLLKNNSPQNTTERQEKPYIVVSTTTIPLTNHLPRKPNVRVKAPDFLKLPPLRKPIRPFSRKINTTTVKPPTITTTENVVTLQPEVSEIGQNDSEHKSDYAIKLGNLDEDEIMEFSDFTIKSKSTKSMTDAPINITHLTTIDREDDDNLNIGSTLSIEYLLTSTEPTYVVENLTTTENNSVILTTTSEKYKVNTNLENNIKNDILNRKKDLDSTDMEYQNDPPLKVVPQDKVNQNEAVSINESWPLNHKNYKIPLEAEPEARAEIFELFSSGSSAKTLEQILKSRNMTLDELIALRQRGSSQLHLAEITQQREETVKYQDQPRKNMDDHLDKNDVNSQKPENNKFNVELVIHKPDKIIDIISAFGSLPVSENIKEPNYADSTGQKLIPTPIDGINAIEEFRPEEEIYESFGKKNLSRIKPSIIASGAILGVTTVVFLTIFIICRIRQKQKYTYRNTFSRAVFQTPSLTTRKLSNSSSLNTIMVNVVGTSTIKRHETYGMPIDDFDSKSDIENDSLDANDSWDTIPDFMK